jgi:signal transduction histidine kinase
MLMVLAYLWNPKSWLDIAGDGLIALADFAIPILLTEFARRRRKLTAHWIFWVVILFLLLCGITHSLAVVSAWNSICCVRIGTKFLAGLVSVVAAFCLFRLRPKFLSIPMPDELSAVNRALTHQIAINRRTEEDLRRLNVELENRVRERTTDLERTNQELSQYAYIASHDLQEPLRMVSNYTELLQRRYVSQMNEEANLFMNYSIEGARKMQALLSDLLTYTQIERGSHTFRQLPISTAVERATRALRLVIARENAQIQVEPLPMVFGDETQLTQVFHNLIGNALKYRSAENPLIRIWAMISADGSTWTFYVKDNGAGFDMRYKSRLFNMFQRLETKKGGTGMGLALCKKIIQHHGGEIDVESSVGVGTTVHFTLPATNHVRSNI